MCASLFDPFVCETTKACAHQHKQRSSQFHSPSNVSVLDILYAYRAQDDDDFYILFLFLKPGHSYYSQKSLRHLIHKQVYACVRVWYIDSVGDVVVVANSFRRIEQRKEKAN